MKKTREMADVEAFVDTFPLREELRDKRILITGASGLIGRTLVHCLERLNDVHQLELVLYTPRHTELTAWIQSNTASIDYILHLACPTASHEMVEHPVEVINAIVDPTRQLLAFAQQQGAVMVYVSSMEVYGAVLTDEEITEEYQGFVNPLAARSSYPMGKRLAETLCYGYAQEYGVDVRVARLVQTLGAGISADDRRVFATFARSVIAGQDIVLHTSGRSSRKYLYVTDAVSALLYILLRGSRGEAYNAAHPDSYASILDVAQQFQREFAPAIAVRIEQQDNNLYPQESHLNLSTAKLESLGWRAQVPLQQMMARLIESLNE